MAASVVYIERGSSNTPRFTERIAAAVREIEAAGCELTAVAANGGLHETVGIWIFFRTRDER